MPPQCFYLATVCGSIAQFCIGHGCCLALPLLEVFCGRVSADCHVVRWFGTFKVYSIDSGISLQNKSPRKMAQGPSTSPCHALYYKKSKEVRGSTVEEKNRHPPCNEINIRSRSQTVTAGCMVPSFCGRLVMQPQIFGCANLQLAQEEKKREEKKNISSMLHWYMHLIHVHTHIRVCTCHMRHRCLYTYNML